VTTAPTPHLSESLDRVSAIDALRGLAALAVVIYHARNIFWIGLAETWRRSGAHPDFNALLGYLSAPFSYGGLGVTLFFVLSGYCIHRRGAGVLAQNPDAPIDYRAFAVRRFWRIYPTYVAALLITAAIDWVLATRLGFRIPGQDDSLFAFGVSLVTLQGYLAPFFGTNGVFWTLAMEVHLYIAYPILFLLSKRIGPGKTLAFTLLVSVGYLVANGIFGIEQHLPYRFQRGPIFLPYWFTWATGFYLAEMHAGRVKDLAKYSWPVVMAAGVIGGLLLTVAGLAVAADLCWALFFAGLLRWSLQPSGLRFWSGWLGSGLAAIGVFSYSLYAIHGPILEFTYHMIASSSAEKFATLWPAIGAVIFAVACAWLFFQLVERWSIRPTRVSLVKP
jgi:peptidoglycan/LPS O-acetylase OafA/YrhL